MLFSTGRESSLKEEKENIWKVIPAFNNPTPHYIMIYRTESYHHDTSLVMVHTGPGLMCWPSLKGIKLVGRGPVLQGNFMIAGHLFDTSTNCCGLLFTSTLIY